MEGVVKEFQVAVQPPVAENVRVGVGGGARVYGADVTGREK